jgi:transposase
MEQPTRFIGMDVHKDTIVVAVTAAGDVGKATPYGTFPNTAAALEKLVKRLRQAGSGPLKFCYEAGPCGYGVHRTLTKLGEDCMVVAPSMIPRKSGDRHKNDKRDADSLAVLHRGGLLTAVWVPDAAHEAMRDLIRTRLAAVRAVRAARQQLSAFLLRHERIYPNSRKAWTKVHRGWLADQGFAQPAQQIVLEESIEAVRLGEQRRDRVDGYLRAQIPTGPCSHWCGTYVHCAVWTRSPAPAWRRPLATRRALPQHPTSWPTSAWCHLNIPPAPSTASAPSPRPVTFMPALC